MMGNDGNMQLAPFSGAIPSLPLQLPVAIVRAHRQPLIPRMVKMLGPGPDAATVSDSVAERTLQHRHG